MEYQAAIVVAVIGVWLLVRHRRLVLLYALGGVPGALALGAYQWAVLGSPFTSSYSQKDVHKSATPLITGVPKPVQALKVLFGSRGILLFTPIVAAGLWGLWRLARRVGPLRDDAIVGLTVFVALLLLQAGWPNPWGGEMPGPRYMIAALPFLAVGIAEAWTARPRLVVVLGGVSTFSMAWPLLARHLVAHGDWLITAQLTDVNLNGFMPTLFTMALGSLGWAVHGLLVMAAAWNLQRTAQADEVLPAAPG